MTKAKYTVKPGLAQVITTGEPVLVITIFTDEITGEEQATVARPVVTQEGINHRTETYPISYLETRFDHAKRNVDMENFVQDLRDEAANKRFQLSEPVKTALKSNLGE